MPPRTEIKPFKTDTLLERANRLNRLSEVSQVALGMCLVAIKEQKAYEPEYSSFDEYYKNELSRTKGDISKLLTVGRFMLDGGFPEETEVGYTKLYTAFSVFPDKDPQYVLAAAQSNTISEMLANRRDEAFPDHEKHQWEYYQICTTCNKRERC